MKSITELFSSDINETILTVAYRLIRDEEYPDVTFNSFNEDFNQNLQVLEDAPFDEYTQAMGASFAEDISNTIKKNLHRVLTELQGDDGELSIATVDMHNEFCGILNVITALYLAEVYSCFEDLERGFIEGYDIREAIADKALETLKTEIANGDFTCIYEVFNKCDTKVLLDYITYG